MTRQISAWRKEDRKEWIDGSYFASPGLVYYTEKRNNAFLTGIIPYKEYLAKHNIDLILVKVPMKGELSAAVFLSCEKYFEDPAGMELCELLLKNDIEVVDPLPEMWRRHAEFPLHYFYHIPQESHPCVGTSWIIAEELAKILQRYDVDRSAELIKEEAKYPNAIGRYGYPGGNPQYPEGTPIQFPVILDKNIKQPFTASATLKSPFLFISNSFAVYPSLALGGSIPHYVAYFSGVIPAWSYQDGLSSVMLKNCILRPQVLNGRKVIILVMHPNMWVEPIPEFPEIVKKKFSRLVFLHNYSNSQLMEVVKTPDEQLKKELKVTEHGLEFAPSQQLEDKVLQIPLPSLPEMADSCCMIRLNYESRGYVKYELTGMIDGKEYYERNGFAISKKTVSDDIFLPENIQNPCLTITNRGRTFQLRSMEIFRCE